MNDIIVGTESNIITLHKKLDDLVEQFLLAQDVKPSSKATYRRTLKQFTNWVIAKTKSNLTREDILEYKHYLEGEGCSPFTVSNYLAAVRKYFEWLEGMKLYPNVAKNIKGAKRVRGFRKDPLTIEQIKELLSIFDRSTLRGLRDYAIVNLLIRTGPRTIEITRADVDDIRQESGEAVLFIQGKGRDAKDEFVLLTDDTLRPIREYLHQRGNIQESDPLFASLSDRNKNKRLTTRTISMIVKTALRKIGLDTPRLSAHSTRHSAVTLALKGGASLQEAQALARHASINTTMIYAQNMERIANAPERKIDLILASSIQKERSNG